MRCSGRASELSCSACWAVPRGCAVDSGPRTAPMRGSSGPSSAWCGSCWRAGFWPAVLRRVLDGERRNDMSKPPDVDRQPQPDYPSQGVRMFTRWSLRVGLACSLACSPLVLAGQEKSLPQQIADQLVLLAGGIHTGYRFNHAKGLVVTGTFTPAAGAPSVSRAAHPKGGTGPVTVRFSDASGGPNIPDTDPGAVPRGLAIPFRLS